MRHQTRFDWNFAFGHGVQRSVPPSLVFLPINEPESENDARRQAGECFTFFLGGGVKKIRTSESRVFPHKILLVSKGGLARWVS